MLCTLLNKCQVDLQSLDYAHILAKHAYLQALQCAHHVIKTLQNLFYNWIHALIPALTVGIMTKTYKDACHAAKTA